MPRGKSVREAVKESLTKGSEVGDGKYDAAIVFQNMNAIVRSASDIPIDAPGARAIGAVAVVAHLSGKVQVQALSERLRLT